MSTKKKNKTIDKGSTQAIDLTANRNTFLPVYIIPDITRNKRGQTESLFTNPYFIVNKEVFSPPIGLQPTANMTVDDQIEAWNMQQALKSAREKYPNSPVLVIKDTSVSNTSSDKIASIIESVERVPNALYDLCYINRFNDQCQLYTRKIIIDKTTTLVSTQSPHGVQAIIYTPNGRDIVLGLKPMKNGKLFIIDHPLGSQLNAMIFQSNISASCIIPNLIEYNVIDAISNTDYSKVQECSMVFTPSQTNVNTVSFFWFFIILVLLLLLGYAMIKIGPKS
jgi:hypothetical protein